ncbi:hypothetical protein LEP1GSC024_4444 [Leptospira noguchii str. 2001034031]|uniref:Uncharacterized protein n=1 Tax=Leptospira noguchii str. 2001034031 TaxID=1193053 RepID=M6YLV0_9LEPT|nr:hypothetical protein LEP1GSC024_4444 [Leptospira noguchii str. 2001034031]
MYFYIFQIIATVFFFVSSSLFGENWKLDLEQGTSKNLPKKEYSTDIRM